MQDQTLFDWFKGTAQSIGNAAANNYIAENFPERIDYTEQDQPVAAEIDGAATDTGSAPEFKLALLAIGGVLSAILLASVLSR